MKSTKAIAVFDSGVGGLSVLKELQKLLPAEYFVYFGDTKNIPYGEKSKEELKFLTKNILDYFQKLNPKAVVSACNTTSATILEEIKKDYDFDIFGMIEPVAKHISSLKEKKIAILATPSTVASKAYSKALKNKEVLEIPCPNLVEIVENNAIKENIALIRKYVQQALDFQCEKIVLGCTHYPYLSEAITQLTKNKSMLIDPAKHTAKKVYSKFRSNNKIKASTSYFVSSNPEKFKKVGRIFIDDIDIIKELELSAKNFN